ncbi:hypothetical protein [Streptomyces sp. HGB0020]|uniref:hypothetical protein n=1 Tax=Streptomyces sp. HGB0020 TaxID=1078086 RepID=UPI00034E79EA|nr:hypothetical protein [Streptomyces sp. HGB0020]EPD59762.1 hypothetical protein HMPREF1211_05482 [Streptomyces sp. HGB0020]
MSGRSALVQAPGKPPARRRTGVGVGGVLLVLGLLVGATACSSSDPPGPGSVTSSVRGTTPSADTRTGPETTTPPVLPEPEDDASEAAALPEPLVGVWESKPDGGSATIAYRFTADGRYRYTGLLFYPNTDGNDVQITFIAQGTARVDGDILVTTPTEATRSRIDPADPAGNYTDQPSDLTPERHTWEVADDELVLADETGTETVYVRRSS